MGMAKAVRSNKLIKTSVLSGALSQAKTATWMVIDNTASLPLKDLRIHTAHASFFLLPSGGGEERRTKTNQERAKTNTHTHHSHYSGIKANHGSIYRSSIYRRARYVHEVPQPFILEVVEPDVSGE